jgi:hypothetical protein
MAVDLVTQKLEQLDREVDRLRDQLVALDRERQNARHIFWLALLGLPTLYFLGFVWMVVVLFFTVWLYVVSNYLIGVRRREYRSLIEYCERDKATVERKRAAA